MAHFGGSSHMRASLEFGRVIYQRIGAARGAIKKK
jgi:hypothetical protein